MESDELDPHIDVGDVVVLKSGGPEMVVAGLVPGAYVNDAWGLSCIWFDNDRRIVHGEFDRRCVHVCDGMLEPDDMEDDE